MGFSTTDYESIVKAVEESNCFGSSARQHDLFIYLLSKLRVDESDEVNAYTIAFDVFGRDSEFDNSTDSLVRVEMHRLRKNLERFSENNKAYNIVLPKQSYTLSISQISGASQFWKAPRLIAAAGLVVLLTIILSLVILSRVKPGPLPVSSDPILSESAVPSIYFEIHADNVPLDEDASKDVVVRWETLIDTSIAQVTHNADKYDYKIQLSEYTHSESECSVVILITTRNGEQIFQRRGNCGDGSLPVGYEILPENMFKATGRIANNFMFDLEVDPRRREIFSCLMMATWLVEGINPSRSKKDDVLGCLNPDLTSHSMIKSQMLTKRGQLYLEHLRGNLDLKISDADAYQFAKESFDQANEYFTTDANNSYYQISLIWSTGQFDPDEFKALLQDAEAKSPRTGIILYLTSLSYAFFLDDWENANRALNNDSDTAHSSNRAKPWVAMAQAVASGDNKEAKKQFELIPPTDNSSYQLFGLWVGCAFNDMTLVEKSIQGLESGQKRHERNYYEFLLQKNYGPELTQGLLSLGGGNHCASKRAELGFP